jgi:hypothetical protein
MDLYRRQMPRRDLVLTGLIAFGAGVAVGANWPKLRKKVGPLLEKLGFQLADLGDFLSTAAEEEIFPAAFKAAVAEAKPVKARRFKTKVGRSGEGAFAAAATRRKGAPAPFSSVRAPSKRKASPRKTVPAAPVANGTYGA